MNLCTDRNPASYLYYQKQIALMSAFEAMDKAKWIDGCKKYLATGHKGQDFANK